MRRVGGRGKEGGVAETVALVDAPRPDAHQLGAWGIDENDRLRYAAFLPSAAYAPHLTPSFVYHMVARNDWAHLRLA